MDKSNTSQTEHNNLNTQKDDDLESTKVIAKNVDSEMTAISDQQGDVVKEQVTDQTLIHEPNQNPNLNSRTKTFVKEDHKDDDAETKKFAALDTDQLNELLDDQDTDQSTTRQLRRQRKKEKRAEKVPVRRIFPIWLRIIVIFLLSLLALIIGMIIGYSMLGDGEPFEVLTFEFWERVIDYISGVE